MDNCQAKLDAKVKELKEKKKAIEMILKDIRKKARNNFKNTDLRQ